LFCLLEATAREDLFGLGEPSAQAAEPEKQEEARCR
jgi:hypothetical protein